MHWYLKFKLCVGLQTDNSFVLEMTENWKWYARYIIFHGVCVLLPFILLLSGVNSFCRLLKHYKTLFYQKWLWNKRNEWAHPGQWWCCHATFNSFSKIVIVSALKYYPWNAPFLFDRSLFLNLLPLNHHNLKMKWNLTSVVISYSLLCNKTVAIIENNWKETNVLN